MLRPIKIKMTAFGPYSNIEIVDFQELNNRNLFLITGPTGAGKTTIFDALAFAMYGEASGNVRSIESLRSQFAAEELLTEVELDFELRGKKYHVHRIPKQQKLKSRGEGYTEQKPEATLTVYEQDKKDIYTGVKTVNDEIEKRIGINSEQFRQIMMIPQGEFRKLLTSSSEEREKVLKKLFDTKLYNDIQYKLENEAKALFSEIKVKRELREHELSKIESDHVEHMAQINDETVGLKEKIASLETIIQSDMDVINHYESEIKENTNQVEGIIKGQELAKKNNDMLKEYGKQEADLKVLESSKDEMNNLELVLKKGALALQIIPLETSSINRANELKEMKTSLMMNDNKLAENNERLNKVEVNYEALTNQNKMLEIERLVRETNEHIAYIDQVKKVKALTLICKKLRGEQLSNQALIQDINDRLKKQVVLKENLEKSVLKSSEAQVAIEKIRNEYKDVKTQKNKLQNLNKILMEKEKNMDTLDLLKKKDKTVLGVLLEAEKQHKKNKMNYFLNQAAILAEDLKTGESCPVCGSKEHEKLAIFTSDMITKEIVDLSEQDLKLCEEKRSDHQHKKNLLIEKIDYLNGNIQALYIECEEMHGLELVKDIENIKVELNQVENKINEFGSKLKSLEYEGSFLKESIMDNGHIKTMFSQYDDETQILTQQLGENEKRKLEIVAELSGQGSILKEIEGVVPKEFLTGDVLKKKIRILEEKKEAFDCQLEECSKKREALREKDTKFKTSAHEIQKQIAEAEESVKRIKIELDEKIIALGFESYDTYDQSKIDRQLLKVENDRFEDYNLKYNEVKIKYKDLATKCRGLEFVDMAISNSKLLRLKEVGTQITDKRNNMDVRLKTNQRLKKEIKGINEFLKGKEEKYSIIGNLARVATGKNSARITFERYVLAAFLDDIIIAANVRLRKMSLGRFVMARTQAMERKNKQSGLELEVFDNYTGKSRHVKTLSGGESFKASLSMALGLSDVVQSYAGGVQLDTMFIDEGFGTLDQESLDSAINCLIDLQKSGRLVGIISHVQELKERIDVRLEVTSTNKGSSTEFVTT